MFTTSSIYQLAKSKVKGKPENVQWHKSKQGNFEALKLSKIEFFFQSQKMTIFAISDFVNDKNSNFATQNYLAKNQNLIVLKSTF